MADESNHWHFTGILSNHFQHSFQVFLIIQQCFPVDSQYEILSFLELQFIHECRTHPTVVTETEIVDENVPHHIHLVLRNAFGIGATA